MDIILLLIFFIKYFLLIILLKLRSYKILMSIKWLALLDYVWYNGYYIVIETWGLFPVTLYFFSSIIIIHNSIGKTNKNSIKKEEFLEHLNFLVYNHKKGRDILVKSPYFFFTICLLLFISQCFNFVVFYQLYLYCMGLDIDPLFVIFD